MNSKAWFLALCFGLLGLLLGGAASKTWDGAFGLEATQYIPPLKVVGDVANIVTLQNPKELGKLAEITFQGTKYQAGKLADLIAQAKPEGKASQVYLVGSDGFIAAIGAGNMADCYISFTAQNGWEAVNLKHPVNSNVKAVQEIVVIADGSARNWGFRVISAKGNLVQTTPGQLEVQSLKERLFLEGQAEIQHDGQYYESRIYTRQKTFQLADLTPVNKGDIVLVLGAKGQNLLASQGYFEVKDNLINYWQPEERSVLENVKGVVVNPPAVSLMDTYFNALHYLQNGQKVLLVVVDGFTYQQYSTALASGSAPFLQKIGLAQQALGVYPPQTRSGFAAILTGQTPAENGVATAESGDLKVPSLFEAAQKLNKRTLLLEPVQNLLNVKVQSVVGKDQNADGSADDEVSALALADLDKGYDLIVIRFHAIADCTEQYGGEAQKTQEAVRQTDKLIAALAANWKGRIILTADQAVGSGDTGPMISYANMFVPYQLVK